MKFQKQHQASACERSSIELNRLSSAVSNHGYRLIILLLLLLARNLDQIRTSQLEIEKSDARGDFIGEFPLSIGGSYLQNTTQIFWRPHIKFESNPIKAMPGNNAPSMDFSAGTVSPKRSRRGKRGGGDGNSIGGKYRDGTQRPTAQQKERLRSNMIADKERKAAVTKKSKEDKASARLKALEEKEATKLEALEKKLEAQKQKLLKAQEQKAAHANVIIGIKGKKLVDIPTSSKGVVDQPDIPNPGKPIAGESTAARRRRSTGRPRRRRRRRRRRAAASPPWRRCPAA